MADDAMTTINHIQPRRKTRRRVLIPPLVLLLFLSMSTWLGCNMGYASLLPPTTIPADPSECSNGIAVPDPLENPGLVEDCEILLGIRDSLAARARLNWSQKQSIYHWEGIGIDTATLPLRVTWLRINHKFLAGTIPPELGSLSSLAVLDLSKNDLIGEIPAELGDLANLVELRLASNELTGILPPELGNLSNLLVLMVSWNDLTGEIPAEFGNLSGLQWLRLDDNNLSGSIPPELGKLSNLLGLYLSRNPLEVAIPSELGNLTNLKGLYLEENYLTGEIPPQLGNLSNLEGMYLTTNQLTGTLPAELAQLTKLRWLDLSRNDLTGGIPPEFAGLSSLSSLELPWNQLSGAIPGQLGDLPSLTRLRLFPGNRFSGCIPVKLRQIFGEYMGPPVLPFCDRIRTCSNGVAVAQPQENAALVADCALLLDARDTLAGDASLNWTASVPISLWQGVEIGASLEQPRVTKIRLIDRGLTGRIPSMLAGLDRLDTLGLAWNHLQGDVPEDLKRLDGLREIRLEGNALSGCLPQNWQTIEVSDLSESGLRFCQ